MHVTMSSPTAVTRNVDIDVAWSEKRRMRHIQVLSRYARRVRYGVKRK